MASSFAERFSLARAGDHRAMQELLGRWRPLLRLQARTLLGTQLSARLDPSDIVQDSLTQAFQDLGDFRGQTEPEWVAWLRRIVAGHAAKAFRHHTAVKRDARRDTALTETFAGKDADQPADAVIDAEQALRLADAIESLPEAVREVLVRRVFHREPFDSIARTLGTTAGAARVTWTRALRKLRERLESDGGP